MRLRHCTRATFLKDADSGLKKLGFGTKEVSIVDRAGNEITLEHMERVSAVLLLVTFNSIWTAAGSFRAMLYVQKIKVMESPGAASTRARAFLDDD